METELRALSPDYDQGTITIKTHTDLYWIQINDVLFIKADGSYSVLYLLNGAYSCDFGHSILTKADTQS